MANYEAVIRTNYFRVKDEDAYRKLLKGADVYDFSKVENGIMYHAFGCEEFEWCDKESLDKDIRNREQSDATDELVAFMQNFHGVPEAEDIPIHLRDEYKNKSSSYEGEDAFCKALRKDNPPEDVSAELVEFVRTYQGFPTRDDFPDISLFYEYEDISLYYMDTGAFFKKMQEIIMDGDAMILMESGHEKYRYVIGYAFVVTTTGVEFIDMVKLAKQTAARMLGLKEFDTVCEY